MPSINYGANGSSGFLYPVFQAAYHGNGELDAADYGHWTSSPYTLSGDDHSAIAYTIPLILDDGTVYGVLGVEILESYLQALLPGTELQNDSSGTYLLGRRSEFRHRKRRPYRQRHLRLPRRKCAAAIL